MSLEKKTEAIKFLYSMDIISEKEMQDILRYLEEGNALNFPQQNTDNYKCINSNASGVYKNTWISDIDELDLTIMSNLSRAGIYTIGDLEKLSLSELSEIKNMQGKRLKSLMIFLEENNIKLKDE